MTENREKAIKRTKNKEPCILVHGRNAERGRKRRERKRSI